MAERVPDLDTGLLLALDALLRDRNVTHAAERLAITQSALSARLNRLRQLLNDPLLVPAPSGRGMVPTPHALALRPELDALLERLGEFFRTAQVFDPATTTRVFRVAATANPAAILAPDLVPRVAREAPNARLAFVLPDKARIVEHLEEGSVDLFVGAGEDGADSLMARTLFEDEFVTTQRIGHPRGNSPPTLDEFCALDHLLISTSGGQFAGMMDRALAALGRERRVAVSIQSYALAPLVLTGSDCLCTLPRRFLERFTNLLELFEPPLAIEPFQMKLFWHPRMQEDPAHAWLRRQVVAATAAGERSEDGATRSRCPPPPRLEKGSEALDRVVADLCRLRVK